LSHRRKEVNIKRSLLIAILVLLAGNGAALAEGTAAGEPRSVLANAQTLMKQGKFDEARSSLKAMIGQMPAGWKAVTEKDNEALIAYWDRDRFLTCSTRDREQSGKKRVKWAQPSYSMAYYMLAYISVESRNMGEAMQYIDQGLALDPGHPMLLNEKAMILQQTARHEEAVRCFDEVLGSKGCVLDYDKARALRGRGVSLIDLKRLDEAEQSFRESLKIAPDNQLALRELQYISRIRSGAPAKAPVGTFPGERK
jgi:tetratricopeptide (TPR) repeat protein